MKQEVTKAEVINMDLDPVKFKKCCLGKINPKYKISQNIIKYIVNVAVYGI